MNIAVWNVRDINDLSRQSDVISRVRKLHADIVCMLETHVKSHNAAKILSKNLYGSSFVHNYSETINGRVWILWKQELNVTSIDVDEQCVTVAVNGNNQEFYLTYYCIWTK